MSQTSSMPYAPSALYTPVAPSRSRMANWAKLLIGPGMLAMLGENDGPSMLSYAATGASYGIGFSCPSFWSLSPPPMSFRRWPCGSRWSPGEAMAR
jgi:hypothetical protein